MLRFLVFLISFLVTADYVSGQGGFEDQDKSFNQLKAINRSNWEVGIMTGINGSTFQFEPQIQGAQARIGIGQAVQGFVKWGGNTGSAFRASAGYQLKSNELRIPRPDSSVTLTYDLHSVSVPIQYIYQNEYRYLGGKVFQQFFFGGGGGLNIHTQATREVSIDQVDFTQTNFLTNKVKSFELSFVFTLGSRFIVSKTGSVYLALRGANGITNINENMDLFTNPGGRAGSIQINQVTLSILVGVSTSLVPKKKGKADQPEQDGPF